MLIDLPVSGGSEVIRKLLVSEVIRSSWYQKLLIAASGFGSSLGLLHKFSFQDPGRSTDHHLKQDLCMAETRVPRGLKEV